MPLDDSPTERFPSEPSALPPAVHDLLERLANELARSRSWREGGGAHIYRDNTAGVRVVLEPLAAAGEAPAPPPPRLSARERQIAGMVAEGHSNKTIAHELGISIWTVSTHLRRIFTKLDVRSRAAMVGCLADQGMGERRGVPGAALPRGGAC